MTATQIVAKATAHAREVSENGLVSVVERDGVLWLTLASVDGTPGRSLMAVGMPKFGIRHIRQEITKYFEGK